MQRVGRDPKTGKFKKLKRVKIFTWPSTLINIVLIALFVLILSHQYHAPKAAVNVVKPQQHFMTIYRGGVVTHCDPSIKGYC